MFKKHKGWKQYGEHNQVVFETHTLGMFFTVNNGVARLQFFGVAKLVKDTYLNHITKHAGEDWHHSFRYVDCTKATANSVNYVLKHWRKLPEEHLLKLGDVESPGSAHDG
jgi:hypothetical protein